MDIILGSLTPAVLVAQADLALHAFHKDLTTKWLGHQGPFFYACAVNRVMSSIGDKAAVNRSRSPRSSRVLPVASRPRPFICGSL